MTPKQLAGLGLPTNAVPAVLGVRPPGLVARTLRVLRRRMAWLLLIGWIALPLLPVIGLGLSVLLGVGLL